MSVKKRHRQEITRYKRNVAKKEAFKKIKRQFRKSGEGEEKLALMVKEFQKAVDKAAKSGAIHRNKAAREKARMMKLVALKGEGKTRAKSPRKKAKAKSRKTVKKINPRRINPRKIKSSRKAK